MLISRELHGNQWGSITIKICTAFPKQVQDPKWKTVTTSREIKCLTSVSHSLKIDNTISQMFLNAESSIMKPVAWNAWTSALKFISKLLIDWMYIRVEFLDKMPSKTALSEEWDFNKDKRSSHFTLRWISLLAKVK